jgi:citrate lyase synthetase
LIYKESPDLSSSFKDSIRNKQSEYLNPEAFIKDPTLNIGVRFAGEEPFDNISNQYNLEMKRTLPCYGIKFVEIPRKQIDQKVISATRVRDYYKAGNMKEIEKLVPKTTSDVLFNLLSRTDAT